MEKSKKKIKRKSKFQAWDEYYGKQCKYKNQVYDQRLGKCRPKKESANKKTAREARKRTGDPHGFGKGNYGLMRLLAGK